MEKKKSKKMKIIIFFLLLLLAVGGYFLYRTIKKQNSNQNQNLIEVLDSIKNYDYQLEDRDTEIYKENFQKLKDILEKNETVDYKLYAEYLSKLFLIDLYTIQNKISKYDVGSLDFIYPNEKEKFKNKVMDTLYKLVEDNSFNTRKQELPTVLKVDIDSIEDVQYQKGDSSLNGYLVNTTITYQKDLGYDKNVTLTLVKEEDKLYVVKLVANEV